MTQADDPDASDNITGYAITGGADASAFSINSGGTLRFVSTPDFEAPTDVTSTDPSNAPLDNTYVIVVTATGGVGSRALTVDQVITVAVTNVVETPARPSAPNVASSSADSLTAPLVGAGYGRPAGAGLRSALPRSRQHGRLR